MAAGAVAGLAATAGYELYLDASENVQNLGTSTFLGINLRTLGGIPGALPPSPTFDVVFGDQEYHVQIKKQGSCYYWTAWHTEHVPWSIFTPWIPAYNRTVEDIPIGWIPADHLNPQQKAEIRE